MAAPKKYTEEQRRMVVPVSLPKDLVDEIRQLGVDASKTLAGASVSAADIMRQAIIIGLPKVRATYASFNKP